MLKKTHTNSPGFLIKFPIFCFWDIKPERKQRRTQIGFLLFLVVDRKSYGTLNRVEIYFV